MYSVCTIDCIYIVQFCKVYVDTISQSSSVQCTQLPFPSLVLYSVRSCHLLVQLCTVYVDTISQSSCVQCTQLPSPSLVVQKPMFLSILYNHLHLGVTSYICLWQMLSRGVYFYRKQFMFSNLKIKNVICNCVFLRVGWDTLLFRNIEFISDLLLSSVSSMCNSYYTVLETV